MQSRPTTYARKAQSPRVVSHRLRLRDAMQFGAPSIATRDAQLPSDAPLELASAIIAFEETSTVRIVEGGQCIGRVTDMDLLRDLPADSTPVSEVALDDIPFVRPETPVEDVRRASGRHRLPVPVVAHDGATAGVVRAGDLSESKSDSSGDDVERGRLPMVRDPQRDAPRYATDVMIPLVFHIPSDASIARASALMVEERVTYAPVVSPRGRYAGMIDGIAILRRHARNNGYVVP